MDLLFSVDGVTGDAQHFSGMQQAAIHIYIYIYAYLHINMCINMNIYT